MTDQREDFEEAAARLGFSLRMRDPVAEDGEYQQWQTQGAWDMWQKAHELYTRPPSAVVPEWIKCSDRMPTSEDGYVWLYFGSGSGEVGESVWQWDYCDVNEGDTHWMPTGLKPPAKPKQEQES